VVELAANPVLAGMVGPMRDMVVESQRLPMARVDRLAETLSEHRAIASRLAAGDAEGAEGAMKAHIRAAADRYGIALV
jgi:GntR family transcriptional repressor for pyruvate dehydrogenase complex